MLPPSAGISGLPRGRKSPWSASVRSSVESHQLRRHGWFTIVSVWYREARLRVVTKAVSRTLYEHMEDRPTKIPRSSTVPIWCFAIPRRVILWAGDRMRDVANFSHPKRRNSSKFQARWQFSGVKRCSVEQSVAQWPTFQLQQPLLAVASTSGLQDICLCATSYSSAWWDDFVFASSGSRQ